MFVGMRVFVCAYVFLSLSGDIVTDCHGTVLNALCTLLSAILDRNVFSLSGNIVTDCLCTFNQEMHLFGYVCLCSHFLMKEILFLLVLRKPGCTSDPDPPGYES